MLQKLDLEGNSIGASGTRSIAEALIVSVLPLLSLTACVAGERHTAMHRVVKQRHHRRRCDRACRGCLCTFPSLLAVLTITQRHPRLQTIDIRKNDLSERVTQLVLTAAQARLCLSLFAHIGPDVGPGLQHRRKVYRHGIA